MVKGEDEGGGRRLKEIQELFWNILSNWFWPFISEGWNFVGEGEGRTRTRREERGGGRRRGEEGGEGGGREGVEKEVERMEGGDWRRRSRTDLMGAVGGKTS